MTDNSEEAARIERIWGREFGNGYAERNSVNHGRLRPTRFNFEVPNQGTDAGWGEVKFWMLDREPPSA